MRDAGGRFQPGASGNPRGRPRDRGLQHEIERALAKRVDGRTRLQLVAEKIVELAVGGDLRAAEFLGRRLWPEKLALEDSSAPPTLIQVVTGFSSPPFDRGRGDATRLPPLSDDARLGDARHGESARFPQQFADTVETIDLAEQAVVESADANGTTPRKFVL